MVERAVQESTSFSRAAPAPAGREAQHRDDLHEDECHAHGVGVDPVAGQQRGTASRPRDVAIPLLLQADDCILRFSSTTTVFGTPIDITVSELAIEAFFPADASTAEALAAMHAV